MIYFIFFIYIPGNSPDINLDIEKLIYLNIPI